MIIPRYWAEGRVQHREAGRQITVRRFGWSNTSQEEAEKLATGRAEAALARIRAGEKLDRREQKVPYNGAEGLPIREEIVATHGDSVITRNSYGALCLNTPNVLFADIDLDDSGNPLFAAAVAGIFLLGLLLAYLLGFKWGFIAVLVVAGALCLAALEVLLRALRGGKAGQQKRRLAQKHQLVQAFIARNPDWRVRVYATPAGLRVLALHQLFDPSGPQVAEFFKAIRADRQFVKMCQRQQCFRARVSPKPWRIGIEARLRPRPGVWPIDPERLPARREWVHGYEKASEGYASCRFLEEIGQGPIYPDCTAVQKLHDDLCRASSQLPLA